jgi:predicted NBD/HSP70 family sugar kinase
VIQIGIDVGGTKIEAAALDADIARTREITTTPSGRSAS